MCRGLHVDEGDTVSMGATDRWGAVNERGVSIGGSEGGRVCGGIVGGRTSR
jgi:hypothetical protein